MRGRMCGGRHSIEGFYVEREVSVWFRYDWDRHCL